LSVSFSFLKRAPLFFRISLLNKAAAEIPPFPPLKKGSCEKIRLMHEKNSSLVQGRGKFTPPKPAGDTELQGIPSSSAKRRPQSDDNLRKTKGFSFRIRPSLISRRQRRTQRLFWRREFSPPLDMVWFSNFPIPEFFHSFRGPRGDLRRPFQRAQIMLFLSARENPCIIAPEISVFPCIGWRSRIPTTATGDEQRGKNLPGGRQLISGGPTSGFIAFPDLFFYLTPCGDKVKTENKAAPLSPKLILQQDRNPPRKEPGFFDIRF